MLEGVTRRMLEELSRQRKRAVFDLDEEAWEVLRDHPWPGNLAELRLVLAAAVEESPRDRIDATTLRRYLRPS
jgi:transcriptional regulator with PAS, ATPase and Fis domain